MRALNILVIDDDPFQHTYIKCALQNVHHSQIAANGHDGLAKAQECNPDIILLDLEMPGLNGYEVCDQLKQNDITAHIPVVFMSSHESLRIRMQAYEMGADDYMVKPFNTEDMLAKITVINKFRSKQDKLLQEAERARRAAMAAMSGSSDMGKVAQFSMDIMDIRGYEELARKLFSILSTFALNSSVMMKTDEGRQFFSSRGTASPLECELISKLHDERRFIDFGCRTQINFPHISLLINNMPLDNMELYGRYKDYFPSLLAAADAKISMFNSEHQLVKQYVSSIQSFTEIQTGLAALANTIREDQQRSAGTLGDMQTRLAQLLPSATDASRCDRISQLVGDAVNNALKFSYSSKQSGSTIIDDLKRLQQLTEEQIQLVDNMLHRQNPDSSDWSEKGNKDKEDEPFNADIELF
ncbi:MAG: response regulator [Gammaproteobacteria bacterium]|nr:response regulator [Gammaproteobacteria bacterium]MDH5801873.1 response regulator [Gammaproteobacteria bacterium]